MSAEVELAIESYCGFLTSYGTYRVVGEIRNKGHQAIGSVYIKILFYDHENRLIVDYITRAELEVLRPGRATPFAYELTNKSQLSLINHCEVQVFNYTEAQPKRELLRLYAYHDIACIRGEISNVGTLATSNVRIYVTFYDRDGKVVDTSFAFIDRIEPWKAEVYEVSYPPSDFANRTIFKRARYYSVTAESDDYILESETGKLNFRFSPFATFSVSPTTNASIGQVLTFNASNSFDIDGEIVDYLWNFGDGSYAEGIVVTHSYSESGSFNVKLTVVDDDGLSSTKSAVIDVSGSGGEESNILFKIFGVCIAISAVILLAAIFVAKRRQRKRRKGLRRQLRK